jgi:hypothetical protein
MHAPIIGAIVNRPSKVLRFAHDDGVFIEPQCRKWRMAVNTMARPRESAASITS